MDMSPASREEDKEMAELLQGISGLDDVEPGKSVPLCNLMLT